MASKYPGNAMVLDPSTDAASRSTSHDIGAFFAPPVFANASTVTASLVAEPNRNQCCARPVHERRDTANRSWVIGRNKR